MQEYWYPWTPARYRADTLHLTPLEDGVYRRLIDHYMETKLPLPNNEAALSRIVGLPLAEFRQISGTVLEFFKVEKSVLRHKKCDQVLADQHDRSERHRNKSAAGGKAKAEKYNNNNVVSATGIPEALPNPATRQTEQTGKDKVSKDTIVGAEGVSDEVWKDFVTHRKAKKAPVPKTVLDAISREAAKAGMSLQEALPENREETALAVVNPKLSFIAKLQSESLPTEKQSGKPKIRENPSHQNQLSQLLQQTYVMLKKFGESADVAETRDEGFQMVLGDYPVEDVQRAFIQYLKVGREVPTPADIIEILDPTVKPLCPRMYQTLVGRSKKGPIELTRDEKRYIDQYEDQQLLRLQ